MGNRECEHCGENFRTLSKLRLHDCPEEDTFVDDVLLPEPQPNKFPERVLEADEFEKIKGHSKVERVEKMINMPLPGNKEAISFIMQIDDHVYGLHCDHDTAEWSIVADGTDFSDVKESHSEWLSDDIGEVTGGSPDPEKLDVDVPENIEHECDMCSSTHELDAQPDSFASSAGFLEYEGFCEETGNPIIITKNPDEFVNG